MAMLGFPCYFLPSFLSLQCLGFSLRWLFLRWNTGSRAWGLQQLWNMSSELCFLGSRAIAVEQGLSCSGRGSIPPRPELKPVSCTGTWIRYHWATYHMVLMVTQVEKQMKAWGQMTISPLTIGMERQDLVRVRFMRLIEKRKKERERKGTNGQKGVQVGGFDVWAPSA